MNLGERLKQLRVEKDISQTQLAKDFNIARSTLSQYESNQRTPSDELKIKFSEYFNVSLDFLLGKTDIKNYDNTKPLDNINKTTKDNGISTIAAHFDGEEFTEDELNDIENFINFVISKKKK